MEESLLSKVGQVIEKLTGRLTSTKLGIDSGSLEDLLDATVDAAKELVGIEQFALWLLDNESNKLKIRAHKGLSDYWRSFELDVGESITGKAVKDKEVQIVRDLAQDKRVKYTEVEKEVRAMICIPLIIGDKAIGALSGFKNIPYDFSPGEENILRIIANCSASAILLAKRNEESKDHIVEVVHTLVSAFGEKNAWTAQHQERVMIDVIRVTHKLGLDYVKQSRARNTARLHDIGKFSIEEPVLNRNGCLTEKEWIFMKNHPIRGVKIIERVEGLGYAIPGIRDHHERLDGSGYPAGLKGEQIELIPRLIAVTDSYDAMTFPRPYKPIIMPPKVCTEELCRCSMLPYNKEVLSVFRALEKMKCSSEVSEEVRARILFETEGELLICTSQPEIKGLLGSFQTKDKGHALQYDPEIVKAFVETLKERNLLR
jgi:HD-GYP domain-containing protein (c-di-GMP phosphodiesterase class II)